VRPINPFKYISRNNILFLWIFYKLIWTNLCFRSSYASVLTIMAFSLERYIAICRPLQALPWSDCTRVSGVSSLCWFLAMLFSLPHLLFTKETHIIFKAEAQWSYARMQRWKTKKERTPILSEALGLLACPSHSTRPPSRNARPLK